MSYSIVLRIISGSFEDGYEIEAEIRKNRQIICTEQGKLPPQTEIPNLYQQTFPINYQNWGSRSQWGSRVIDDGDGEEYRRDCIDTSKQLERTFQNWFRHADLGAIQTRIAREIPRGSAPSVILEANRHLTLQCLPWHQWDWLNNEFPNTEIVLSRKAFKVATVKKRLRILVILGSDEGIDLKPDWEALTKNLNPLADLVPPLQQPTLNQLRNEIRQGCDILFFAGHSDRNRSGDNGWIKINDTQTISIDELLPEFRVAISKGLRMIFLNSCSGMGIASRLSELEIPYMVVMREPIHNDVAGKFIEYCLKDLADGNSLTSSVSQARNKLRELEDKYICASWMPIIFQSREAPDYVPFPRKIWEQIGHELLLHIPRSFTQSRTIELGRTTVKVPPIGFAAFGLLAALIIKFFIPTPEIEIFESMGERSLFPQKVSPAKQEGIELFRSNSYTGAIEKLEIATKQEPNDSEAQIYLNNARALQQSSDPKNLPIIPIVSSKSNGFQTGQEILRGAAIAQIDINQKGGINGRKVVLKIVLDNNDNELAKQVANKLVKDPNIKGVVGHLNSNASVAVSPIYQANGLVMLTPVSSTMDLTGKGNFILRTTANSEMMANTLADYIINVSKKRKLGICSNSKLTSGKTFERSVNGAISSRSGKILTSSCDLVDRNLSPQAIVEQMVKQGAEGLVFYFHADDGIDSPDMQVAQKIARAAKQRKLPLFGPHALIAPDILKLGADYEGMILVTPRHPQSPLASKFTSQTRKIFAEEPTWRDMTAYDATVAIAAGLNMSDGTRYDLQKKLHDPNFSIDGSSGPIKFSQNGDRVMTSSIARVECNQNNKCKFALIPTVESKPPKPN